MPMTSGGNSSGRLRLTALRRDAPTPFDLRPDEPARRALADRLGLLALRKARLAGELIPGDGGSWRLVADLGATVVQPCVVTLDPVTTRIDEPVERRFRPAQDMPRLDAGTEVEVPEEEEDPLPDVLDLTSVLTEALSLALPVYPRSPAAEAALAEAAEPAEVPEEEERPNPFAALEGLKDRLSGGNDKDS